MPTNYEKVKEWRKRFPEKVAEQSKRYRAKHPETHAKALKKYREANIDRLREVERVKVAEYRKTDKYRQSQKRRNMAYQERQRAERLKIAGRPQPDRCEICSENEYRIVWDHCHIGGHFRGWICDRCNRTLGLVKDKPEILKALARYLEDDNVKVDNGATEKATEFSIRPSWKALSRE